MLHLILFVVIILLKCYHLLRQVAQSPKGNREVAAGVESSVGRYRLCYIPATMLFSGGHARFWSVWHCGLYAIDVMTQQVTTASKQCDNLSHSHLSFYT